MIELHDALVKPLRSQCPKCHGEGRYIGSSFHGGIRWRDCEPCRGRGVLFLPADELTEMLEALRKYLRDHTE